MDPNVDYYAVLGVSPDASKADINKAFKQMAEAYHPDKVSSLGPKLQELANEEMKKINVARSVLCDEEERGKYDALRKGAAAASSQPDSPAGTPPPPPDDEPDLTDDILETQSLIWEIKALDIDTSDAEKIFDEAKFHYQQGDEQKATALLKEAKGNAENARMYKDALNLIQKCRHMITEAAELGADITKANEFYSKTQPAMVNKDYMTAVYYADLTWKQANKAVERYTYNVLMDARETMKKAKAIGLDVGKVEEVFNQAKPLVKEKKFRNAVAVGKQSSSMINDLIQKYSEFKYNQVNFFYDALKMEENPEMMSRVKPLMTKLGQMYDNKHYLGSLKIINDLLLLEQESIAMAKAQATTTAPVGRKPEELDEDEIEIWEYMDPEEDVVEIPEEDRKYSIYERTLFQVWEDGILEEQESRILTNLRNKYSITDAEHTDMEKKVREELGH